MRCISTDNQAILWTTTKTARHPESRSTNLMAWNPESCRNIIIFCLACSWNCPSHKFLTAVATNVEIGHWAILWKPCWLGAFRTCGENLETKAATFILPRLGENKGIVAATHIHHSFGNFGFTKTSTTCLLLPSDLCCTSNLLAQYPYWHSEIQGQNIKIFKCRKIASTPNILKSFSLATGTEPCCHCHSLRYAKHIFFL